MRVSPPSLARRAQSRWPAWLRSEKCRECGLRESQYNMAQAREVAGRRQEAIRLFEEVRDARERVLGPDDLDTLTTLYGLGVAYWFAGRPHEAIPLLERARWPH